MLSQRDYSKYLKQIYNHLGVTEFLNKEHDQFNSHILPTDATSNKKIPALLALEPLPHALPFARQHHVLHLHLRFALHRR